MDRWRTNGLEVQRTINVRLLGWPDDESIHEDSWLGGNRTYSDLTGLDWDELKRILEIEDDVINRISSASDPADEEGVLEDGLYDEGALLLGLDISVASASVALSAAGCVPFASCNGGVFGRHHKEDHPLVAFYSKRSMIPLLLECAEETNTGIINGDEGELVLHGNSIEALMRFARAVLAKEEQFNTSGAAAPPRA